MKTNEEFVIGVLGGMGTYATINLFQKYAEVFPAEKEWERPRIIIDNRCTMPSRVLAYLEGVKKTELIEQMTESIEYLIRGGGENSRIVLACNTSHLFLPEIFKKIPYAEKYVVSIIEVCAHYVKAKGYKQVYLLATEGTIQSGVYQTALERYGVKCIAPSENEYSKLRLCIEAVKQNNYSEEVKQAFLNFIHRHENIVLGCTELPILYGMYGQELSNRNVIDPLFLALLQLRMEFAHA